eukprot:SAG31_NODE_1285_length_9002_cov_3.604852_1_plen_388_part_00
MLNKVEFNPQAKNSVDADLLQTMLVGINLLIPVMGVGMAVGGIAWEYRKYYQAKLMLIHGVGGSAGGLGFGLMRGLAGKTFGRMGDLFGNSIDVSTSQALLDSARKHAAKCEKNKNKARRRFIAAEGRVVICDEWLNLVESTAADEKDAERLFGFIEKSVMTMDNKTGKGTIMSVEQWWGQILDVRHGEERVGRLARLARMVEKSEHSSEANSEKVSQWDMSDDESSSGEDDDENLEAGIIRPTTEVEFIDDVVPEQPMEAYLFIGTQGAMAEADEAEHFVPTKRLTPFDWQRMKEFVKSEKGGAGYHERQKLEIQPDIDKFVGKPIPFHLREEVIIAKREAEERKANKGKPKKPDVDMDAEIEGVEAPTSSAQPAKRKKKKRAVAT